MNHSAMIAVRVRENFIGSSPVQTTLDSVGKTTSMQVANGKKKRPACKAPSAVKTSNFRAPHRVGRKWATCARRVDAVAQPTDDIRQHEPHLNFATKLPSRAACNIR